MAISSMVIGNLGAGKVTNASASHSGALSGFSRQYTVTPGRYMVGFSFDASNNDRGQMTVNGVQIFDSYTAGSGSYRTTSGWGTITVGAGGILSFVGGGTASSSGTIKLFYVQVAA